jgi:hypothetical protein
MAAGWGFKDLVLECSPPLLLKYLPKPQLAAEADYAWLANEVHGSYN